MHPVSSVFAAYIDAVQNTLHAQVIDTHGTEVKALMIGYQGVNVPFQYQIRGVEDQSLCSSYQSALILYSQSMVTAKKLLLALCTHLFQKPSVHWRYTKTKNMYCNAAVSCKPALVGIIE